MTAVGASEAEAIALRATERRHPASIGLDAAPDEVVLAALYDGQERALRSLRPAIPELARLARAVVARLDRGGRLVYLAAGSPGLIALADALEIPQTYGEPPEKFLALMAGGALMTKRLLGGPEDDAEAARADLDAIGLSPHDALVGISASGSTRYTLEGILAARARGACTGAIANNPSAPMLEAADIGVCLDSGPEVIAGSTRMGAGTAQKAALNMLSTLVATRLGHVHDGHMVSLRPDNAKLRERAARMVADIAGVDPVRAEAALEATGGNVKRAVLVAAGADADLADVLLVAHGGRLRPALADVSRATWGAAPSPRLDK